MDKITMINKLNQNLSLKKSSFKSYGVKTGHCGICNIYNIGDETNAEVALEIFECDEEFDTVIIKAVIYYNGRIVSVSKYEFYTDEFKGFDIITLDLLLDNITNYDKCTISIFAVSDDGYTVTDLK